MEKDLLSQYVDMFNENFPTYLVSMTDEELEETLKKCIKEKKKFKVKLEPDVIY